MKNLFFLIIISLFISCNTSSPDTNIDAETTVDNDIKIPTLDIDTNTTFLVKTKCAVIPTFSTTEIDSIRKEAGEENFAEIASDILFYNATAKEGLEGKGIKVVSTDKAKIVFLQPDGSTKEFDKKQMNKDMIYFIPGHEPLETYTVAFESDLAYFGIDDNDEFSEGYWVTDKAVTRMGKDHIYKYFYKTSFINDEPLMQVFDDGDIKMEEVLSLEEDGSYKHPSENIFYVFSEDAITITEGGAISGLAKIEKDRIKE
jgi:WD40 repeat protein